MASTLQNMLTYGDALLTDKEVGVLADAVRVEGRATLLAPSRAACRAFERQLAEAGVGLGVAVDTPASWLSGLWGLEGDGHALAGPLERRMFMASVLDAMGEGALAPLRMNPGTVRMLCRMAEELLPGVLAAKPEGAAERVVFDALGRYAAALDRHGLIEPSQAASALHGLWSAGQMPASARGVVPRDVDRVPRYLADLLVLAGSPRGVADRAPRAAADEGVPASLATRCRFLEVEGPHAKARAYADEVARLAKRALAGRSADAPAPVIAVAAPRPTALFDELAVRLAAAGISASATGPERFGDTMAGSQFAALSDLAGRWDAVERRDAEDISWWPAPELTDWLYCPLSGLGAAEARRFDKKLRGTRSLGVEGVMRQLQGAQGRVRAARAKLAPDAPYAQVPAVCADVVAALRQGRPVTALKCMLQVADALPASAFGSRDGRARAQVERAVLRGAIDALMETARALEVPQRVAVDVLDDIAVQASRACDPEGARAEARFMTVADAALLAPGSVDAVLFADVDGSGYPLSHEEGPLAALAERLDAAPLTVEPVARLRRLFSRAIAASASAPVLARVTHDRQASDRYPAAIWTELKAAADAYDGKGAAGGGASAAPARLCHVGEGDLVRDFDPASGAGMVTREADRLDPQALTPAAVPYLVLREREREAADRAAAPLVPRQFSASQIESYLTCPLCWFVSNRVRPARLDAGFGSMEMGNFVHDVLYRFHTVLPERGMERVTRENVEACLPVLREVFDAVRAEHARGKTDSSGALVALSSAQNLQIDRIYSQLEGVVRYEAGALRAYRPAYLEYSFNGLGLTYAGRPLGGRIDRVDVDPEGHAVVIDYKHRSGVDQFRLKDPTVVDAKTGAAPASDAEWLPAHTQTLIYAQALRRSPLGLDPRGAVYLSTKGRSPAMRGAVSYELAQVEPGDGRVPGLRSGFPDEEAGGTMTFDALLDRVEATVARRLDALDAGDIRAASSPCPGCGRNHGLGFTGKEA